MFGILLLVKGSRNLEGRVQIGGSKNAALPIIAASLLIKGKVTLENVPEIGDVFTFLDILRGIGVGVIFKNNTLELDSSHLNDVSFDLEKIKKIRVSILLLAPLLSRLGEISIPTPGGCNLGKRPIDAHLTGLKNIGYEYTQNGEDISLKGKTTSGDITINAGFGVTSTENLIVANVIRKGTTTIRLSAIEPHVMNLIDFLRQAGANIAIRYDHTIIITGVEELNSGFTTRVYSDYIQSGTYMIIGALASKEYIDIENACIDELYSFIEKLHEAGVKTEDRGSDTLRVFRSEHLKGVSIQTNIFPGFPTDLQSPFAVLMTQAEGISKIHEVLFEGRLNFLVELEKMEANTAVMNPHEALVFGSTQLEGGATVTSWDLRAGAAMVIAGLIATGETTITNVEYIHRGYEDFVQNLRSLGADIQEVNL